MKKLALLLIASLFAFSAYSAFLKNVPAELKQPDGTIIHCFITGDEFHRRVHDKDNYTIVQNPQTGFYVYATQRGNELVPTEYVVGKSDPKQLQLEPNIDIPAEQMEEKRTKMLKSAKITTTSPTKGKLYNLVVFIRFADDEEFTDKLAGFNSMFNNNESGANSVYNYYKEESYGQLEVKSVFYPVSTNEKVLSYKDSNPRNYYVSYSVTNVIGYKDDKERYERENSLLSQALNSIKGNIPSSEVLDGNGDGAIDNVSFIIKGSFEDWGKLLWAHASSLESQNLNINGKLVSKYTFYLSELVLSNYDIGGGVGELCHELFHSMGAPDLYHYSMIMDPVSIWDVMGTTFSTPQHIGVYMKFRYGKWITQIPEITQEGIYMLNPLSSPNNNCYKIKSPNSDNEYFIFEYRNQVFYFQNSNISKGLLIYRINSTQDGKGNAGGPPDEVYVYRPYGYLTGDGAEPFAPFNKSEGRTIFNDTSNPSSFLSAGQFGLINISDIGLAGETISFKVNKSPQKLLMLDYPNNPLLITVGDTMKIKWKSYKVDNVNIEYTINGTSWNSIVKDLPSTSDRINQFLWKVPDQPTNQCKIRISNSIDPQYNVESKSQFSIIREIPPSIAVIFPNGNESLEYATQQTIKWKSSKVGFVNLFFSIDDGITWKTIRNSVPSTDNQYSWVVPGYVSDRCKIKIVDSSFESTFDDSDNSFNIISPPEPAITVASPNGGETLEIGSYHQILWQNLKTDKINIEYTLDDGLSWNILAKEIDAKLNAYGWKIPETKSGNCKIRIIDSFSSKTLDISDSIFSTIPKKIPSFWDKTNGFSGARIQAMISNGRGELIASCFRSKDNGESWQKMNIDDPNVKEFHCLFRNPINGFLFATSPDIFSGIFRSTDQGENWIKINQEINTKAFALDKDGNIVAAGWDGNIYKSTNNGENWNLMGTIPDHGNPSCIAINRFNEIFVGSLFKGMHISRDGAKTWSSYITQSMEGASSIVFDKEWNIYATGETFNGVIVSYDNGVTWENKINGFGCPNRRIKSLFIDGNDILYAGSYGAGLYRSVDKGKNWVSLQGPNVLDVNSIIVNRNEDLFAGTNVGVKKMSFLSKNWEDKNNGISGDQIFQLMADRSNNVFIGSNSGIHFSSDQGRNWEVRNVPVGQNTVLGLFETSKGTIFSGLNGHGTYWSINKGLNWEEINIPANFISYAEDLNQGYVYGSNVGAIARSNDDGKNWEVLQHNPSLGFQCIAANNEGHLFVGTGLGSGNAPGIMISKDFGKSFLAVPGFQGSKVFDIQIDTDGTIYAALEGSIYNEKAGLYKSLDDGNSWEYCGPQSQLGLGGLSSAWKILFTKSKKTIIILQIDGIRVSNDKGKTWPKLRSIENYNSRINKLTIDQRDYLYVTLEDGNIFASNYPILDIVKEPISNAGNDQSVNEGIIFTLDGSASYSPNNYSLSYLWTAPVGITLSSASAQKPTFTVPQVSANTTYTFSLVVNDGTVDSPANQVVVTVKNQNQSPVANAEIDQNVNEGAIATLDGSLSSDPDGDPLTYKWTAPTGITLSSTSVQKPTFTTPQVTANTTYTFSLVVNDGTVDSPADQVVVTVKNQNQSPVANAGIDQNVNEGAIATLDGSLSSDPDGDPLTYKWTAPTGITLSSTSVQKPTFTTPQVTANTTYTFSLVVNDGTVDSSPDQVVITVKNQNIAPVSNAGTDQVVNKGIVVGLDGSLSSDPDGNLLTYKWTAPAGIVLNSSSISNPTFTAPIVSQDTPYIFTLVVNDGSADSPVDQVTITVKNENKIPVANAGVDRTVMSGTEVVLDGSLSSDPDGNTLTYVWVAPSGIALSSSSIAKPIFIVPRGDHNAQLIFTLTVNDGTVFSTPDQVIITVKNGNSTPLANAGIEQTVNKKTTVMLDGSRSSDSDLDNLSYQWTAPAGIILSSNTIAKPTFTAPEVTQNTHYTFTLIVNDGFIDSSPATVKITVLNAFDVGFSDISAPAFKVYPNPTTGIVTLEFLKNGGKEREVCVTNMVGAEIFRKELIDGDKFQIDFSAYVDGIYLIKVTTDNQQYFSKVIVKKE